MDGYGDDKVYKKEEPNKRIKGNVARDIIFTSEMELSDYCKSEFLNKSHKTAFLKLFASKLRSKGYEVTEYKGDADSEIAHAALSLSETTLETTCVVLVYFLILVRQISFACY